MSGMAPRTLIWLGPLVFLVHDLEEVFLARSWVERNRFLIAGTPFEPVAEAMGYEPAKFGLVVAVATIVYGVISWFAASACQPGLSMNLYVATVLTLFVNVITHVGQALLLRMYTPGVITAALVVLPYTVAAFRTLSAHRLLTATTWKTSPLMGIGMLAALFGLMIVL